MKETIGTFRKIFAAEKKASERPLGGFGPLPPVNTYAPGMRRATQNGPAQNQRKQSKQKQKNNRLFKVVTC